MSSFFPVKTSQQSFLGVLLVVLYIFLALHPLPTTGLTYDEPTYMSASKAYSLYFYRLYQGHRPLDPGTYQLWSANQEHPPLVKLVSAATWGVSLVLHDGELPFFRSVVSHRLAALLFAGLGIWLVFRWSTEAWDLQTGILSGLTLIFMPRFLGHSRFLALDVPMAVAWLATAHCFWKSDRDRSYALWTGMVFGLALATKLNALFIPIALVGWLAAIAIRDVFRPDIAWSDIFKRLVPYLRALLSMVVVAPLVLYLIWPRLWFHPLEEFGDYLAFHARHIAIPVEYLGTTYHLGAPWHYPFVMLMLTLPLTILLFVFVGLAEAFCDLWHDPERPTVLILFNALLPILVLSSSPLKYDGIRLMMPALPFLALLAGLGAHRAWQRITSILESSREISTGISVGLLVLIVLPGLWVHIRQVPYEYVFYNNLVGGERGALNRGFELDYWAQSYVELVPWLNRRAEQRDRLTIYPAAGRSFRCELFRIYRGGNLEATSFDSTLYWISSSKGPLADNVQCVERPEDADFVVVLSRPGMLSRRAWTVFQEREPVFEFRVDEVPLVRIFDQKAWQHQLSFEESPPIDGVFKA